MLPCLLPQILLGVDVDEALLATKNPCSRQTLYRRTAAARSQVQVSARDATRSTMQGDCSDMIVERAVSEETAISSLSPSPTKRRKRSRRQLKEGDSIAAIKAGVAEGLDAEIQSHMSTSQNTDNTGKGTAALGKTTTLPQCVKRNAKPTPPFLKNIKKMR